MPKFFLFKLVALFGNFHQPTTHTITGSDEQFIISNGNRLGNINALIGDPRAGPIFGTSKGVIACDFSAIKNQKHFGVKEGCDHGRGITRTVIPYLPAKLTRFFIISTNSTAKIFSFLFPRVDNDQIFINQGRATHTPLNILIVF